ncbi:hypothetical protein HDU96_001027 [Phlyctochytrium bullatum]|nr:hypothetical protein HDU96_001027 [Phlyctochytrium bullatum]
MLAFFSLFTLKPIEELEDNPDAGHHVGGTYKMTLTGWDLISLGVGCIIGAGIFTLTGNAVRDIAGTAVVISYILSGFLCALSALCYSELAAMIPVSSSAYFNTYATVGELAGWIIGWDLCLKYLVGASAAAVGWAYYLEKFLNLASNGKITFDPNRSNSPVLWTEDTKEFSITGFYFNMPALLVIKMLTVLLAYGIKQSTWVVSTMAGVKIVVILMLIFGGIKYTNSANLQPFTPFGFDSIFRCAIMVFFASIGFDAVSTTAQEARSPSRDMPIGIIGSLSICTVLYIAVCLVLCTLSPYTEIPKAAPVDTAFVNAGGPQWAGKLLAFGALCGLTSVLMVTMIGQPRIFPAMAYDGLFPNIFAFINPKTGTPVTTTLVSGVIAALLAGCFPIDVLSELSSVGTLFAFFLVSAAVIFLRIQRHRPYKIPGGKIGAFVFPILSMASILVLLAKGGTTATISRVFIWMAIGLVVYFSYGFWWSKLRHPQKWPTPQVSALTAAETEEKKETVQQKSSQLRNKRRSASQPGRLVRARTDHEDGDAPDVPPLSPEAETHEDGDQDDFPSAQRPAAPASHGGGQFVPSSAVAPSADNAIQEGLLAFARFISSQQATMNASQRAAPPPAPTPAPPFIPLAEPLSQRTAKADYDSLFSGFWRDRKRRDALGAGSADAGGAQTLDDLLASTLDDAVDDAEDQEEEGEPADDAEVAPVAAAEPMTDPDTVTVNLRKRHERLAPPVLAMISEGIYARTWEDDDADIAELRRRIPKPMDLDKFQVPKRDQATEKLLGGEKESGKLTNALAGPLAQWKDRLNFFKQQAVMYSLLHRIGDLVSNRHSWDNVQRELAVTIEVSATVLAAAQVDLADTAHSCRKKLLAALKYFPMGTQPSAKMLPPPSVVAAHAKTLKADATQELIAHRAARSDTRRGQRNFFRDSSSRGRGRGRSEQQSSHGSSRYGGRSRSGPTQQLQTPTPVGQTDAAVNASGPVPPVSATVEPTAAPSDFAAGLEGSLFPSDAACHWWQVWSTAWPTLVNRFDSSPPWLHRPNDAPGPAHEWWHFVPETWLLETVGKISAIADPELRALWLEKMFPHPQPQVAVGGRFAAFGQAWTDSGASPFLCGLVREGLRFKWTTYPLMAHA